MMCRASRVRHPTKLPPANTRPLISVMARITPDTPTSSVRRTGGNISGMRGGRQRRAKSVVLREEALPRGKRVVMLQSTARGSVALGKAPQRASTPASSCCARVLLVHSTPVRYSAMPRKSVSSSKVVLRTIGASSIMVALDALKDMAEFVELDELELLAAVGGGMKAADDSRNAVRFRNGRTGGAASGTSATWCEPMARKLGPLARKRMCAKEDARVPLRSRERTRGVVAKGSETETVMALTPFPGGTPMHRSSESETYSVRAHASWPTNTVKCW
mmetsp:Transcript_61284/g.145933  ORF Transcript_61284/g.145933 Transcript_61284/m.145933 type:complete len:276 (-) Transcript_61284:824-1651(-)